MFEAGQAGGRFDRERLKKILCMFARRNTHGVLNGAQSWHVGHVVAVVLSCYSSAFHWFILLFLSGTDSKRCIEGADRGCGHNFVTKECLTIYRITMIVRGKEKLASAKAHARG